MDLVKTYQKRLQDGIVAVENEINAARDVDFAGKSDTANDGVPHNV
jgi:hypothetical protein